MKVVRFSMTKSKTLFQECPTCLETKSLSSFKRGNRVSDGYTIQCKDCLNEQAKEYCSNEELSAGYVAATRFTQVKVKFGLSKEEYLDLMKSYPNCAVCKISLKGLKRCIDHDHITGKVRGVTCQNCNLALGAAHDDSQVILRAIDYLNKFKQDNVLSNNGTSNA